MNTMLARLAALLAAFLTLGCANGAVVRADTRLVIDTTSVLRLVGSAATTRSAHAAPVTPMLALTAGHVCAAHRDERADQGMRLWRFSTEDGNAGLAECIFIWYEADLALLRIVGERERWRAYPIAQEAPLLGERLTYVGYDWRDEKRAWGKRTWEGELVRELSGFLVHRNPPDPGASGSPVFNERGEIAGVVSGAQLLMNQRWIAESVGVWGRWAPDLARFQERLNGQ